MTNRLETITELYDQSSAKLVARDALQDAQSAITAQQGLIVDEILALDFDDEEFERKHNFLNGQNHALHNAWMAIQSQMTVLTDESEALRKKADKLVDPQRANA